MKISGLGFVVKLFLCSNQMSMEFQMLIIKSKMLKIKTVLDFRHLFVVFIMLINIKMPTIVGISKKLLPFHTQLS